MIKKLLFFCFLFSAIHIFANAVVELNPEHKKFIVFEPIKITVKIFDNSYQPFLIDSHGGGNATIDFQLINMEEKYLPLPRATKRSFIKKLAISPGKTASFKIDITDFYTINNIGDYKLKAIVSFGGMKVQSNVIKFEVSNGIILKKVHRLIPGYMDRTREYTLRYIARDRKEELFLRVDEIERSVNYGVFYLGKFVRVFEPELSVDLDGFVKVRYQAGYNCYSICYFLSEESGVEFVDRNYVTRDGNPYNFNLPPAEQGKRIPMGNSEVTVPEKRTLWQKLTGQGKGEADDNFDDSSVPKTKSNTSDVPAQ